MIAIFLAPLYLLFHFYILLWLYAWAASCFQSFHSLWFRVPAAGLLLLFSMSPLISLLVRREPLHRCFRVMANYWLGTLQYILLVVLIFDGIRRLTGYSFLNQYKYPAMLHSIPRGLTVFGSVAVLLVAAISIYGIFHARQLSVRQYEISIQKDSPLSGLKIALIADLHLGYNSTEAYLKKMVDEINRQKPDLVCIAGDLFDNEYDAIKNPVDVARILAEIRSTYGVYGCFGNHDVTEKILAGFTFPHTGRLERDPRFGQLLSAAKITMLEDETICIDDAFYLSGRKDPDMAKKEQDTRLSVSELTNALAPGLPLIVMDHQPGNLDAAAEAGVDLLLSGHTHNGQTFPGTWLVRFLWENPCGILQKGSMTSVVTSGAGVWGPAMRVGSDNEIVVLDISFQGS